MSTRERDRQALRSCCTGQVVVAGDQEELGIERGHGSGEVNGIVAAQLVSLGEVTSVAGQLRSVTVTSWRPLVCEVPFVVSRDS